MEKYESLKLKARLLVEGVDYRPGVFEGLGTLYKEQNHGLFGWDFVNHKGVDMPDDFSLSDGTVVQYRYSPDSPFVLDTDDTDRVLKNTDERLDQIHLIPRPLFYDRSTSSGKTMRTIAQVGGLDCFFVCYQNYCTHFSDNRQCAFCNLVPTKQTYDSVLTRKNTQDIGEVAAAAFSEGTCKHILLTGGCFSHEREVRLVTEIVTSICSELKLDRVPGTILPSATTNESDLKTYRDCGIGAIGYSMEIWDESYYRAICPGKSSTTSHDTFFSSIQKAVEIFGPGNVYAVFVMGLEPRASFLEGIKASYDIGANVVPFVWSPSPGSMLEGHRAPNASWYVDVIMEAAEIAVASGVPAGDENHCYQCDGNSLLHDAVRAITTAAPVARIQ